MKKMNHHVNPFSSWPLWFSGWMKPDFPLFFICVLFVSHTFFDSTQKTNGEKVNWCRAQNLFLKTPHHRICSLNTHVLVIFKNPRDKLQITCLARQIYPNNSRFLVDAYTQATEKAHGYLVINLQQSCPEFLRVRDSLFPQDAHFFVNKKGYEETKLDSL